MSFLQALDTAIAMTLIYFLLSLVVAALTEGIATILSLRSNTLYDWIVGVVRDPKAAAAFYDHPLIRTLEQVAVSKKGEGARAAVTTVRKPSYIPARTFAIVVLDLLNVRSGTLAEAQSKLSTVSEDDDNPYSELARTVTPILEDVTNSVAESQASLETWFNSSMERVSGWYRRYIIRITLPLSLLIAVLANASTVELVHVLWNDQTLRSALVQQAKDSAGAGQLTCPTSTEMCTLTEAVASFPLPLGWSSSVWSQDSWAQDTWNIVAKHLLGWLITAVLLSFGSRFWFEVLLKLVNIRLAGQKPSEPEASDKKATGAKTP